MMEIVIDEDFDSRTRPPPEDRAASTPNAGDRRHRLTKPARSRSTHGGYTAPVSPRDMSVYSPAMALLTLRRWSPGATAVDPMRASLTLGVGGDPGEEPAGVGKADEHDVPHGRDCVAENRLGEPLVHQLLRLSVNHRKSLHVDDPQAFGGLVGDQTAFDELCQGAAFEVLAQPKRLLHQSTLRGAESLESSARSSSWMGLPVAVSLTTVTASTSVSMRPASARSNSSAPASPYGTECTAGRRAIARCADQS